MMVKLLDGDDQTPVRSGRRLAAFMLAELESERRWDNLFSRSQDLLARMAEEARQEYRAGLTYPLDPETT